MTPSKPVTAALYARVSTIEQHTEMQFSDLRQYAVRMGWEVAEYVEKESSVKHRPELEWLMNDAKLHKFDVVIVWKLDRFARSLTELLGNIQVLDSAGIRFICLTQHIDTDVRNSISRLTLQILGAAAEFERSLIVERVNSGVQQYRKAFAAGKVGKGRGRESRSGKNLPHGRPRKIFRRDHAQVMRTQGYSFREISRRLEVPLSTLVDALKPRTGKSVRKTSS
jgi:DNA invertase Pin-like site-specific DNA recombinase